MAVRAVVAALALTVAWSQPLLAVTLDYPHTGVNNIGCSACHDSPGSIPAGYGPYAPQSIDDTPANNLCRSCHNDIEAPFVRTHSSLTTTGQYGAWSIECITCHTPHEQEQCRTYGAASYAYTGQVTEVGSSTIRQAGAGWTPNEWAGWLVLGNITNPDLNYHIVANTADTLTVEGTLDQSGVAPGRTFAIGYGKLIQSTVSTPNSGEKTTRFFGPSGAGSFADGDMTYDGICEVCHTQTTHFRNDGSGVDQHHGNVGGAQGTTCITCHSHQKGFAHGGGGQGGQGCGTASSCHGALESHPAHVGETQLSLACADCHDTNNFPLFKDGQDLAGTQVCASCHSAGGSYDGVNDPVIGAKNNFTTGVYAGNALKAGKENWCLGCHDQAPSVIQGRTAPNKVGDNSSYGYYVTGHGRTTTYPAMSWQAAAASGNPGASLVCTSCHDASAPHIGDTSKRLLYPNDQSNTVCTHCHEPGGSAAHSPQFYTTEAAYEASAHGGILCTSCHDVHGSVSNGPTYGGMTKGSKEALCYQCHTAGGVQNDAISGASLSTNIQQAFSLSSKHDLGTTFAVGAQSYTLQCVSCHNVHIVTGKYWDADQGKSPVTRLTENTSLWGASAGQKMSDYVGAGSYQVPNGDPSSGDVLPDYATFCTDCHNSSTTIYSPSLGRSLRTVDWMSEKHGGLAASHGNTSVLGPYQLGLFGQYVLACTDCHEAHSSTNNYAVRTRVNDGQVTVTEYGNGSSGREWDSLCTQCHADIGAFHHSTLYPAPYDCSACHFADAPYTNCANCHSH